ncbi:PIR Superfamily Protein [Plasmodium ovale curtisi]|uniref:PIR Superfamily Protein n=1 Tax=Plasmodium ovale curtisi TaxID=864141 RepID=A0A1A8XAS8_PLAOA|nr:PIR Superfamily Protein [Plasmodium ovale curtisi]
MAAGKPHRGLAKLLGYTPKELFSEIFYQDREIDIMELNQYSEHCNDIKFPKKIGQMKYLCKQILRYLEHSEKWEQNKSVYDECILLNYWVYDTLDKYFNHDSDYMNKAFGTLQLKWSYLIKDSTKQSFYNKCEPLFDMFKHHDWKQRKQLYDYYIDFNTLNGTAKSYSPKCEEYYKIIESKKSLYEHFDNECLSNVSNCPEIYEKCRDYNPDKVLSDLPCHEKIEAQKAAAAEASARALAMQQSQEHGKQARSHLYGTGSTQQNTEIGKTVGNSVLGVAPILLTATALYRYTPVGTWFRKLGGYNQSGISDMDGFSSYTQESGDMFSDSEVNYISYQPI